MQNQQDPKEEFVNILGKMETVAEMVDKGTSELIMSKLSDEQEVRENDTEDCFKVLQEEIGVYVNLLLLPITRHWMPTLIFNLIL